MNRARLKSYAPKARLDFIRAVTDCARKIGLTSNGTEPVLVSGDVAFILGRQFPRVVAEQRRKLEAQIAQHGLHAVMEETAYAWFNRLMALRYMELHGFLDHGFRVLSHSNGSIRPEILENAEQLDLPGLDKSRVVDLKLDGTKDEELYRLLLLGQCHALHLAMPFLFERIDDQTELLLPDNLLATDSVIRKMVHETADEDWEQIEVIGWLYQFYISDRKAEVIGKVVKSEDIPAATQLFTPNWIVKYMVQNSLGRKWLDTYPSSPLRTKMEYYIAPAGQTEEVQAQLAAITPKELNPEELTLIDPACGSGHILCEAYDLFKGIYLERGYRLRDIPRLILKKNLFGLDIDDRAAQMAGFALLMKARADDRFILDNPPKLNVMALQSSVGLNAQEIAEALTLTETFELVPSGELFPETKRQLSLTAETACELILEDIRALLKLFENAKTFGSLLTVPPALASSIGNLKALLEVSPRSPDLLRRQAAADLEPFVRQAELLSTEYHTVAVNPPYMGSKYMVGTLKDFAADTFPSAKSDLFALFVLRLQLMVQDNGAMGLMTPFVWMFLSSYTSFREKLQMNFQITSLIRPEYHSFFEFAFVPICTYILVKNRIENVTSFYDLTKVYGADEQPKQFARLVRCTDPTAVFCVQREQFDAIPGRPLAYWVSPQLRRAFKDFAYIGPDAKKGTTTGDNERFIRQWYEVSTAACSLFGGSKWYPMTKGGAYRKWYGNNETVINWEHDGTEIRGFVDEYGRPRSATRNLSANFNEALTWNDVSLSDFSARYVPNGFVFNAVGPVIVGKDMQYRLCMLNSKVCSEFTKILCPTMKFEVGAISLIPVGDDSQPRTHEIARDAISIARADWDAFETSWDFQRSPLSGTTETVELAFRVWESEHAQRRLRMKMLEEENNRIFIDVYGLQRELTSDVEDDQISLYTTNRDQDIRRLVSCATGCMMGRYSLDEPGLIYAQSGNHGFDPNRHLKFPADDDGIIPITDTDWFGSADIANRFAEFLCAAWPPESLAENLKFVADSLTPKPGEAPIETIRRYLCTGFYKDHLQTYRRRPIYWLFTSGKERAFQALVYLHRYNEGTLSRMRIEYVIPLQSRISARVDQLKEDIDARVTSADRRKREKEREKLVRQQEELRRFDEKLRHYADMRISLDLDDGVKVNYGKFADLLADVKAVTGGSDD